MPALKIGENAKIERTLFYSDGTTPLLVADLTVVAKIRQYGYDLVSYTLGVDPEVEAGDTANEVRIHLTKEISALLRVGPVDFRLVLEKTDGTYIDGELQDIDEWTPFDAEI